MTMDINIANLLLYSLTGDASADGHDAGKISDTCLTLFERDYECGVLENTNGTLCGTYPTKMFIPLPTKGGCTIAKLEDCVMKARFARTRCRFVAPVLIVNDKFICRSSTLARSPEIYCRQGYGYWMQGEVTKSSSDVSPDDEERESYLREHGTKLSDSDMEGNEWMVDKMRNADVNLLQYLKVDVIFDLMVENKKVKYGMNVTSSEKADKSQRYSPFSLLSIPYPGCEFFAEYRHCDYEAENLKYDWKQTFNDATLCVPDVVSEVCNVLWDDYINWDLVTLTKNYLLLHLRLLTHENTNGILLHCISGWDRTPLFVSLMRISLWADGIAHRSLDAREMAYFTIAYDWLLFQHQFETRVSNGEEIFFFCFDFLKYICGDEFSLSQNQFEESSFTNSNGSVKSTSNGTRSTLDTAEPDCVIHCDGSNGKATSVCLEASSDEVGKSCFPPNSDVEPSNDEGVQSAVLPIQQNDKDGKGVMSYRASRIMELRNLVILAYKEAIQLSEQEQTKNTGIAASLINRLTKTFSLAKN